MEMAMPRKSFKSAAQEAPIPFDIDGIVFHAKSQMPSGVLMRFAELTGGIDPDGTPEGEEDAGLSGKAVIEAVQMFFRAALVKEDHKRFFDLLESDEHLVDLTLLTDIAGWLASEYTARPTGENSSNTSPGTGSGPGSTVGALPGIVTYSRPEPTPIA